MNRSESNAYKRYHIETKTSPNIVYHPYRFNVKVKKLALAKLLIKEVLHYQGNMDVVLSRPCVYGVFSGPLGGFAPREELCVGCLRCTTQYPEMVTILKNPERLQLGDEYFIPDQIDTVVYEAESGRIPIKGAGYRGKFGGVGWDAMWTDMSEIVRPTRDGIHGREYISTEIDIGEKPAFLEFNNQNQHIGQSPKTISIPIPILFDAPPLKNNVNSDLCYILNEAAREIQTFAILPLEIIMKLQIKEPHIVPIINPSENEIFKTFNFIPQMLEMSEWNEEIFFQISSLFPDTLTILRTEFESDLMSYYKAGVRVFHLTANYHGRGKSGEFILELIRRAHLTFVEANCRGNVTLIGSGGIVCAEHVPKAIICGLDAVAVDTSALVALQTKFVGKCVNNVDSDFQLPSTLPIAWGKQRLKNLVCSWRDQMLEILGAMGIREVRRLRGEMGRAMFQKELEKEAFSEIKGYKHG